MANTINEETRLLYLFPEEVWRMILEEVESVSEFHFISGASPFFCTLLLPRKLQILFPTVVKVLLHQVPSYWETGILEENDFRDQCSVNKTTLCLVCGASSDAVYEWQNAHDYLSFWNKWWRNWSRQRYDETCLEYTFSNQETYSYWAPKISYECLSPYYNTCVQLFRKHGHQLWYCRMFLNAVGTGEYLEHIPGLGSNKFQGLMEIFGHFVWAIYAQNKRFLLRKFSISECVITASNKAFQSLEQILLFKPYTLEFTILIRKITRIWQTTSINPFHTRNAFFSVQLPPGAFSAILTDICYPPHILSCPSLLS